jgi:peptide/nickel transport system substrate-binding protein
VGASTAGAVLLAACGSDGDSEGDKSGLLTQPTDTTRQAKRGGTSKWYYGAEPNGFDVSGGQAPLNPLKNNVYGQFTNQVPGHLKPTEREVVGDMAESWEWSPDALQLTMKLRQGIKWHNKSPVNGRAMDMDDVMFSWNRYAARGTDRGSLVNAASPQAPVLSATAVDPQTLVFKLKEPLVYLLNAFAATGTGRPIIVPKETDSSFDIRRDMIGTGPWVLTNYTPSVGFTWERNPDYYDMEFPLLSRLETPLVSEYANGLAQFRAGSLYHYLVRPEEILSVKRDLPALNMYSMVPNTVSGGDALRFGATPTPANKPFHDERVRQAISMSYDRDLFIDTFYNVSQFEADGLPVSTYWYTSIGNAPGWWLDPKGKDFGPNAKYFQYDPQEAKKLLAAAGYPNGFEVISNSIGGLERGADYLRWVEVREGFVREIGIRPSSNLVDYQTVYIPKLRDGLGEFDGWAYTSGAPSADEAVAYLAWRWAPGSTFFLGFDANGAGDHSGDPYVNTQVAKAKAELDTEKRKALVYDIQRHLAKTMYAISQPGIADEFQVAWPAIGNFAVYEGDRRGQNFHWWIDDTKAPLKAT